MADNSGIIIPPITIPAITLPPLQIPSFPVPSIVIPAFALPAITIPTPVTPAPTPVPTPVPDKTCYPDSNKSQSCAGTCTAISLGDYSLGAYDPNSDVQKTFYWNTDGTFGWQWNRTKGTGALPWLNIRTGPFPWLDIDPHWILPKKLSEIVSSKLYVGYKYTAIPTNTNFDLIYDIWIGTAPVPTNNYFELEIFLTDKGGNCNWGTNMGIFNDGVNTYKVQKPSGTTWGRAIFVMCNNKIPCEACDGNFGQKNYTIDLKKILDYLISNNYVNSGESLLNVSCGNEIYSTPGAGKIEFNQYRIELNGAYTC